MFNISPIGRNCSREERNDYEKFDLEHNIRQKHGGSHEEGICRFELDVQHWWTNFI